MANDCTRRKNGRNPEVELKWSQKAHMEPDLEVSKKKKGSGIH
jgi:hypothetical protein